MADEDYRIEERTVPVGETMIINGRIRGAGFKYKIKIKNKPVPDEGGEK